MESERVQTGLRLEKRLVKVLKGVAELHDTSLGELVEGIVRSSFAGRLAFSDASRNEIAELSRIYGLRPRPGDEALAPKPEP
jgi:predicted DNA-binding ribbon-helix-helix protein